MQSLNVFDFGRMFENQKSENNVKDFLSTFVQNRQFMKLCVDAKKIERRERRPGFFERLKICPKPPEPPPREPNVFEIVLKRVHKEGVIAAREIISASFASIFSVFASHPFDVLKLRYLNVPFKDKEYPWYKIFSRKFRLFHEIRSIIISKGYGRLYKGHLEAQRDSLFQTISMFYTYQRVYQELENKFHTDTCIFFSGFVSASISVLLLRPYAIFRSQWDNKQVLLKNYGPIVAAYTLKQKQKWYTIFKGCFADFLYFGTQYGLRFLFYTKISEEILKRKPDNIRALEEYFQSKESANSDFEPKRPVKALTSFESLLTGAVSGLLSDMATHPMDVINIRLKLGSLERQRFRYEDTCRRYGQCFRLIWKEKQLKGFYPGFAPTLLKSGISSAVTFAVYEAVHRWLRIYFLN